MFYFAHVKISIRTVVIALLIAVNPSLIQSADSEICSKLIILSFFPDEYVQQVLEETKIPADKWKKILDCLSARESDVVKIIETKAAKMKPNPLKEYPINEEANNSLLRSALLEIFVAVMHENGIKDEVMINKMFDEVQDKKAKYLQSCSPD